MQITDINIESGEITVQLSKSIPIQKGGENLFEDTVTFSEPGYNHSKRFFGMQKMIMQAAFEIEKMKDRSVNEDAPQDEDVSKNKDLPDELEEMTIESISLSAAVTEGAFFMCGKAEPSDFLDLFSKLLDANPPIAQVSGTPFKSHQLKALPAKEAMRMAFSFVTFFMQENPSKETANNVSKLQSISAEQVTVV